MNTRFSKSTSPVDRFLMDFFNGEVGLKENRELSKPLANIAENAEKWLIELSVPGFENSDFRISIENHQLKISAEMERGESEMNYSFREFRPQSFERVFNLPKGKVMEDGIEAKYTQGILSISIPKIEEQKTQSLRTIEVK